MTAAVGSTGNSTGPHLHLEVSYQGQRLNPFYFVDNGYETKEKANEGEVWKKSTRKSV